jgi:hypothetical protein
MKDINIRLGILDYHDNAKLSENDILLLTIFFGLMFFFTKNIYKKNYRKI